jgi:ABC-type amino acid transport substrate-binding protein
MVRSDAPPRLVEVLAGRELPQQPTWRASLDQAPVRRVIAVIGQTPFEKALADRLATLRIVVEQVSVKDVASGVQMLLDRRADAFLADRALLLDAAHRSPSKGDLVVLSRTFKREPVALAMHRGADDLRLVVDRTLSRLYSSDEFRSLYTTSFGPPDAGAISFFQLVALPD